MAPLGPWEVKGSEKVEASEVNGSGHVGGSVDDTALNVLELSDQSRELSPVPVELRSGDIGSLGGG